VIRRALLAAGAVLIPVVSLDVLTRRASRSLLNAPRTTPDEAGLGPALDALGGEVVRVRARDGLRLAGRWIAAESVDSAWIPDPHEAILLLHGWSGSIVPHLVEHGPYLRQTAGVLGIDFRGHGESDDSPTTFGLREIEDVAGALAWLGERGIERVALVGMSMGGITAIAAVAVLGDGSNRSVDMDPAAPAHVDPPRRPRIVGIVADSVVSELAAVAAPRIPGPRPRFVANRMFDAVARTLGADPRETEPIRVIGLLEGVPLLLISGDRDAIVPVADARRLSEAAPPDTDLWIVEGADHRGGHTVDPAGYESRTTLHLRNAFLSGRGADL
jgi:pimeloyl-ACP methyl ester carboxylesterase